jgi:large subunit ribosomal protein L25
VDFLRVSLTEQVHSQVPVMLEGEPIGVRQDGGILVHALHTLEISALPQALPEQITVDVSALEMNGAPILVGDLQLPEGVTVLTDGEETVAVVNAPAVEEETEEAAPADETAAAEEVPATQGDDS